LWISTCCIGWSIIANDCCTAYRCRSLLLVGMCLKYCLRVTNILQTIYAFFFFSTSLYFFLVIWDSFLQRFTKSLACSASSLISCHWKSWLEIVNYNRLHL
jgi:hypothetical protein